MCVRRTRFRIAGSAWNPKANLIVRFKLLVMQIETVAEHATVLGCNRASFWHRTLVA